MATKALAKELGPNIRVNGVSPGIIIWPEGDVNKEFMSTDIVRGLPLKKKGEPSDIASACYFLAEAAPFITGEIVTVDGGQSLN